MILIQIDLSGRESIHWSNTTLFSFLLGIERLSGVIQAQHTGRSINSAKAAEVIFLTLFCIEKLRPDKLRQDFTIKYVSRIFGLSLPGSDAEEAIGVRLHLLSQQRSEAFDQIKDLNLIYCYGLVLSDAVHDLVCLRITLLQARIL